MMRKERVLSGLDAAMLQAAVIAAELAQDDDEYQGYMVRVADEHGSETGTVPVVTAVEDTSRYTGGCSRSSVATI